MARTAKFYLEETILDVLLEAKYNSECIGSAKTSKRVGIYGKRGVANAMNDAIVTGMLVKFHSENKVERCDQPNGRGGWKITNKEFDKFRDYIKHN